mmetsp:Transcript_50315/g.129708  ORF Transcript_50315/g.129708 Transcript_50315/m.129708 type:complete len:230 (-) Transcript_50315:259-948(-)
MCVTSPSPLPIPILMLFCGLDNSDHPQRLWVRGKPRPLLVFKRVRSLVDLFNLFGQGIESALSLHLRPLHDRADFLNLAADLVQGRVRGNLDGADARSQVLHKAPSVGLGQRFEVVHIPAEAFAFSSLQFLRKQNQRAADRQLDLGAAHAEIHGVVTLADLAQAIAAEFHGLHDRQGSGAGRVLQGLSRQDHVLSKNCVFREDLTFFCTRTLADHRDRGPVHDRLVGRE